MDLDSPSPQLAGKEVSVEQRVQFKLDLPNKKVISVKSKPCKIFCEVLRPILLKYNYQLELVQVYSKEEHPVTIDMSVPVTAIDGQRLQIVCKTHSESKENLMSRFELGNKIFLLQMSGKEK